MAVVLLQLFVDPANVFELGRVADAANNNGARNRRVEQSLQPINKPKALIIVEGLLLEIVLAERLVKLPTEKALR